MVFKKLQEIIADKLSLDESEITMKSNFKDDLEADSLDLYEIIMSLEDEFGVTIQNEDLEDIKTVSDAVKYIEDRQ
ncbi:acyl carrier protein [Candidatus Epulonipiscium fishelsonii]|uniref:Acyl carrier protein n=1 Tax=Candidatus Epulonipiscium fishelsonii TaxID=77094 RepID=A0ACC8XB03_9FIRM|nr:acyl carrier protein [Epulopiscium sp. SCG-B11WGA-EpuloA1]ONI41982.1 acyl carrier protein [Epulopiscium sp. SCG-B05WGA-EpuloA1]